MLRKVVLSIGIYDSVTPSICPKSSFHQQNPTPNLAAQEEHIRTIALPTHEVCTGQLSSSPHSASCPATLPTFADHQKHIANTTPVHCPKATLHRHKYKTRCEVRGANLLWVSTSMGRVQYAIVA